MANLRAVLQDQEARRLVDEDPDQHSHPLFRQSPGMKMQGARGREGIKHNRRRSERFPGNVRQLFRERTGRPFPKKWRPNPKPPVEPTQGKETGWKATDEAARHKDQAPRLKQGTAQASRTGQARTCIVHHKPGRRKRGPKEPQSRSRSHARAR